MSQPLEGKLKFYLPFDAPIRYGYRHGQKTYYNNAHNGDDFILTRGTKIFQTCITVPHAKILYANEHNDNGRQMMVDYGEIEGYRVQSYMTHFLGFEVAQGDIVSRDGLLGTINKTGRLSGNVDHLHWSIKINGRHYSPVPYLITNVKEQMKYERIRDKFLKKHTDPKSDEAFPFIGIGDNGKPVRCIIRKTTDGAIIQKTDVSIEEYLGAFSIWD